MDENPFQSPRIPAEPNSSGVDEVAIVLLILTLAVGVLGLTIAVFGSL
jgi:hypothetical protein